MTLAEFAPQDASDYAAIAFLIPILILLVPLLRRTPLGIFGVKPFTVTANNSVRAFLGFRGFVAGGADYVVGHYCAAPGKAVNATDLADFVASLKLVGGTKDVPATQTKTWLASW
jgi:hypothetical protein